MDDNLKNLRSMFDQTAFSNEHFTEKNMKLVHERIQKHSKHSQRKSHHYFQKMGLWYRPILSIAVCLILLIGAVSVIKNHNQEGHKLSTSSKEVQHVSGSGFDTFINFSPNESGSSGTDTTIKYSQLQLKATYLAFDKVHLYTDKLLPQVGYSGDYLKEIRINQQNKMVQFVYPHFNITVSDHAFYFQHGTSEEPVQLNQGNGKLISAKNGDTFLQLHISNLYMVIDGSTGLNSETLPKIANSLKYFVKGGNLTEQQPNTVDVNRPKTATIGYGSIGRHYKENVNLYVCDNQQISFYFPEKEFHIIQGGNHTDILVHNSGLLWNISFEVLDQPNLETLKQNVKKDLSTMGTVHEMKITDDPTLAGTTILSVNDQSNRSVLIWLVPQNGKRPALQVTSTQDKSIDSVSRINAIIKTVEGY